MKMRCYILSLILLPLVSLANDHTCEIYFNNINKYIEIMSYYDNDKAQIQELKVQFSTSRKRVTEAKDISKYDTCQQMNDDVVTLINKYNKNNQ